MTDPTNSSLLQLVYQPKVTQALLDTTTHVDSRASMSRRGLPNYAPVPEDQVQLHLEQHNSSASVPLMSKSRELLSDFNLFVSPDSVPYCILVVLQNLDKPP